MLHPMNRGKHFWSGWLVAVLGAGLVAGLAVLPPFVSEGWRAALMQAFSGVCHQLPARSPHWHGVQLAVCDRCFGIYGGLLAGTLLYPFLLSWDAFIGRRLGPLLLVAGLPAAIDWGGDVVGLWVNTPAGRFATGAIFGIAAGVCLARALGRALQRRSRPASTVRQHETC